MDHAATRVVPVRWRALHNGPGLIVSTVHAHKIPDTPQEQEIIRANDCARRFYRVAFCKKIYYAIEELQTDLGAWLGESLGLWQHPNADLP